MSDNSCEYIVKQRNEGSVLFKKLSAVLACITLGAIACSASLQLPPENLRLTFLLISVCVTALLIFLVLKFMSVEYEISVEYGELTVTAIYGRAHRALMLSTPISSVSEIGEYTDEAFGEIRKLSLQKDYIALSSLSAPKVYYAIFDDEKRNCILYFDVTDEAEAVLKKLLPGAFRASARRLNNARSQQNP